jgi:AcrR family transcriptional regulator
VHSTSRIASISDAPPRRKGELTRERILDAAEQVFAERGFDGATLRDVAARVGLRNPSLYNHFASKDSLYAAVLERDIGPVLRLLVQFVEHGGDAAASAGDEVISGAMQVLVERPAVARLVQHETLSGGQRLTPMLRDFIVPIFAHGNEMAAERALNAGWEKEDVPLLVLAMYHVVVGFFTMAPLYKDLNGTDLLEKQAVARQTRFLIELSERLFTPPQRDR